jgi:GT2 family glycosyltransferase
MKVLVIIVSYNFEPWLERCLGSLRHSFYPVDTVVIDNGSTDQTIQRIRKDYPETRLLPQNKNLGFGRANNIGMQIALAEGYDFVFLLNQDAWIDSNTIGELVELSQSYPQYGILSPVHLTGKGDKPDPGFGYYAQIQQLDQLSDKNILPIPFANAALWMIPVSVLKKVGGFSPLFYHYGEDKDFVNRLTYHDYQVGYSPRVFGNHDREYRPLTHQVFLRTEYVYHLSEYANIHHNGLKAFGYGVLAPMKKCLVALFKGKASLSKDYFCMTFQLLRRSKEVCFYRKTNRLSNPHYIQ